MDVISPWNVATLVLLPIMGSLITVALGQKKSGHQPKFNVDEIKGIAKTEAQILIFEELKPIHKELSKISGDLREVRTVLETLGIKGLKRTPG